MYIDQKLANFLFDTFKLCFTTIISVIFLFIYYQKDDYTSYLWSTNGLFSLLKDYKSYNFTKKEYIIKFFVILSTLFLSYVSTILSNIWPNITYYQPENQKNISTVIMGSGLEIGFINISNINYNGYLNSDTAVMCYYTQACTLSNNIEGFFANEIIQSPIGFYGPPYASDESLLQSLDDKWYSSISLTNSTVINISPSVKVSPNITTNGEYTIKRYVNSSTFEWPSYIAILNYIDIGFSTKYGIWTPFLGDILRRPTGFNVLGTTINRYYSRDYAVSNNTNTIHVTSLLLNERHYNYELHNSVHAIIELEVASEYCDSTFYKDILSQCISLNETYCDLGSLNQFLIANQFMNTNSTTSISAIQARLSVRLRLASFRQPAIRGFCSSESSFCFDP